MKLQTKSSESCGPEWFPADPKRIASNTSFACHCDQNEALDAVHAAILDPALIAWAEDRVQLWLASGPVALRIGTLEASSADGRQGEPEAQGPKDQSKSQRLVLRVSTTKHFAICLIELQPEPPVLEPAKVSALERQLCNSLGGIAGVDEHADNIANTSRVLDGLTHALMLMDTAGAIIHSNAAAAPCLIANHKSNFLGSSSFAMALVKAFTTGRASLKVRVAGASIGVSLRRINYAVPKFSTAPTSVCLVHFDLSSGRLDASIQALLQTYSLTRSEAATLALCASGISIARIAAQRGVSVETARAQLRACRRKTGARTQLELIMLVKRKTAIKFPKSKARVTT
jgi:DNA-binding CsgD family transcriptional regulator